MSNTNLIIAAWGGPRRNEKPEYLDLTPCGTINHIAKQVNTLNKYKNSLAQVTIVCPPCSNPSPEYSEAIKNLPTHLNSGARIELLCSDFNLNSFYSYLFAIQRYKTDFDYYIFIEDDYVFCENDFDLLMIKMYEEKRKIGCEYLLSYVDPYAVVTNGIVSAKVLQDKNYVFGVDITPFVKAFKLCQFDTEYGLSPYFSNKGIICFGAGKPILVPTQMVDDKGCVIFPDNILYFEEMKKKMSADEIKKFLIELH